MTTKISDKDKEDWLKFINNKEEIENKDVGIKENAIFQQKTLDLHGYTIRDANLAVSNLIFRSYNKGVKKIVHHQARLASKAKLDAIVCSAQEVKIVKKVFKKEIITPGIRFSSNRNDQKRTLTPKQAFKNGSDWLVIGRPITKGNIKKNIQTLIKHLN